VRLEQLYPLPAPQLREALAVYPAETPAVWVQEEPENAGAGWFMRVKFGERLFDRYPLQLVARSESASPATGSAATHKEEQRQLVARALGDD
jgi:2-oxoglutarate dehydrogenase complex dehydrogenase (E1) component-like enzyme